MGSKLDSNIAVFGSALAGAAFHHATEFAIACWACRLDTAYFFIRGEYHHQAKVSQKVACVAL